MSVSRKAQSNLVLNVAILLLLLVGAGEVAADRITAGEIATFMLYMGILAGETFWAGFLIVTWSRAVSGGQRIFEVLDAESPVRERPHAVVLPRVRGHVRFEHVSLSYDSKVPVLRDVEFEALPGQLVAILGAPGSGKSTLVHLIPRFYDVSSGRVTLDGIDVRNATLESLRHNVGIVQQDSFAFAATIRDNIAYGVADASMEAVAQLREFIEGLPDGYDTWVGERGLTLSGGQRQRLAIARTILLDPPHPDTGRLHLQRGRGHRVPDSASPGGGRQGQDHLPQSVSRLVSRRVEGLSESVCGGKPLVPRLTWSCSVVCGLAWRLPLFG